MLQQLLSQFANSEDGRGMQDFLAKFGRMVASLTRSLQYEYGRIPDCETPPHNPASLPFTRGGSLAAETSATVDIEKSLGKLATRGHIVNLGAAPIFLRFTAQDADIFSNEAYELLPESGLDFGTFFVGKIEVSTKAAASRYQIFAQ